MKNGSISLDPKALLHSLTQALTVVRKYAGVLAFLVFAGVYGYLVIQINSLSNPVVDSSAVDSEAKASPTPRIDANAAIQLQSLKDNSVNVQTFFDQNRTNPFGE